MAKITISDYVEHRYPNHMRWVDNEQQERHQRSGGLAPYKVCSVEIRKENECQIQIHWQAPMNPSLTPER